MSAAAQSSRPRGGSRRCRPNAPKVLAHQRFGQFALLRKLGAGGMGEVHLAYDLTLERKVALKILNDPRAVEGERSGATAEIAEERTRMQAEARALARLDHPNVVRLFDIGEARTQVYLAMEYVPGRTLRRWLEQQPRDWQTITNMMLQAGAGLASAHRQGILHRDFKPDNLMITDAGQAIVIDFGIARRIDDCNSYEALRREAAAQLEEVGHELADTSATGPDLIQTHSIMGTPGYMSPEQRLGQTCDLRSDEYAFSVAFYEALIGRRPFARNERSIGVATARRAIPEEHRRKLPRWLVDLILQGLEPDPMRRHGSVAALCGAIEHRLKRAQRRRQRMHWLPALMLSTVTVGLLVDAKRSLPNEPACPDAEGQWAAIWHPDRKQDIATAFATTGRAWAEQTWDRVESRIDTHRDQAIVVQNELCRIQRSALPIDDRDFDLRRRCLQLDQRRFSSLIDTFAEADDKVVELAVQAIEAMPPVERCEDAQALRRDLPWPTEPEQLQKVQSLRERLAEIDVQRRAGRWPEAQRAASDLLLAAQQIRFAATLAETHAQLAAVDRDMLNSLEAVEHDEVGLLRAIAAGHDRLVAQLSIDLIYLKGYRLREADAEATLVPPALAYLQALEHPPDLEAELLINRGILDSIAGDQTQAEARFKRALDELETVPGTLDSLMAKATAYLGNTYFYRNAYAAAIEHYRRSIALYESALGPAHPIIGQRRINLAIALRLVGRRQESADEARAALESCASTTKGATLACAFERQQLAWNLEALGDYAAVEAAIRPLLEAQTVAGRRGSALVGYADVKLGRALLGQNKVKASERWAELGYKKTMADPRTNPSLRVVAARTLALVRSAQGNHETALQLLSEARSILEHGGTSVAYEQHRVSLRFGDVHLAAGQTHRATLNHRKALEQASAYYGASNPNTAEYHRALARSLRALGRRQRAEQHDLRADELDEVQPSTHGSVAVSNSSDFRSAP